VSIDNAAPPPKLYKMEIWVDKAYQCERENIKFTKDDLRSKTSEKRNKKQVQICDFTPRLADFICYIFPICRVRQSSTVSTGIFSNLTYGNFMDDHNYERCISNADFRRYCAARENKPEKWYYSLHKFYPSWFVL